jgi:hypothetical protein
LKLNFIGGSVVFVSAVTNKAHHAEISWNFIEEKSEWCFLCLGRNVSQATTEKRTVIKKAADNAAALVD